MKKKVGILLLAIVLTTGFSTVTYAVSSYLTSFRSKYGTGITIDSCSLCHPGGNTGSLNQYANDYASANHAYTTALENLDSDKDGFTNIVEINARTFPGDVNSKPAASDTTAPTVSGFTVPSTSSSLAVSISTFTATDNVAVTGYMVNESSIKPLATATGWTSTAPTSYTASAAGARTLYAWAKDAAGNVSNSMNAQVTITLPPTADMTPPTINSFTILSTSSSLTVPISSFSVTDNVGVTGSMVTESAAAPSASTTGWTASPPPNHTFATAGSKTLYAWAKDAAGNVSSSLSASVNISTASPEPGPSGGMTIWVGQWFKITTKITGSCSGSSGMVSDSGSSVGYLKLWNWDDTNQILQADYYEYDAATAQWSSQSLPLVFIAGSNLDFLCQSQVIDNAANSTDGFTARIVGKETGGVLKRATFKSLGGYYIDTLDQFGAIANCAGGLKLTGALIAESKVPVPSNILSH